MLSIVIPTLGRAHLLEQLATQIAANTQADHHLYLMVEFSDSDSIAVGEALQAPGTICVGLFGSCAAGYNAGYDISTEPYIFLGNDDLEFPPDWDVPPLALLEAEPEIGVVGVQDGHDRMTCFSMVRRSFIEEQSGVYDKPATLVHEYTSQFVDTELAEYAQHRGVWKACHAGGVIHRHPDFGDSDDPNHPNYLKTKQTWAEDEATFEARKAEWQR